MMQMLNSIPDVFNKQEIVYHYTTLDNAIKILSCGTLKASLRKESSDPWERLWLQQYGSYAQICFCVDNEHYGRGFLKSRMWDQYGDKYKGVCIAFFLEDLKKKSEGFEYAKIEYRQYDWPLSESRSDVRKYFWKHTDYEGETEFRMLSLSDKIDVNIKECFAGVVVNSDFVDQSRVEDLRAIVKQRNADMVFIRYKKYGIKVETEQSMAEQEEALKSLFLNVPLYSNSREL